MKSFNMLYTLSYVYDLPQDAGRSIRLEADVIHEAGYVYIKC